VRTRQPRPCPSSGTRPVPDATGLELIAKELRAAHGEPESAGAPVLETVFFRGHGTLVVGPEHVRSVLEWLRERGFAFLASLHGVDYYPQEPRLGVIYELLDMEGTDRITVKARVATDAPAIESVSDRWPTADHQEREVYDMFGVVFDGHPNLRRILMPEDYEGHPQRRDFPIGGEPVLFTFNEAETHGSP
jgi:NADH-quinone oxidoreductase subunit C